MNVKIFSSLKNLWLRVSKYKMKKRDKRLFLESLALIIIYFISFIILSLGRVQQTFAGFSEGVFSNIQMILLTFIFAIAITFVVYFAYHKNNAPPRLKSSGLKWRSFLEMLGNHHTINGVVFIGSRHKQAIQ